MPEKPETDSGKNLGKGNPTYVPLRGKEKGRYMADNALLTWMKYATPEEKRMLAEKAGLASFASLYQMAHAYRSGGNLRISAEKAGALEEASRLPQFSRLPPLTRAELSPACAECPYAKRKR